MKTFKRILALCMTAAMVLCINPAVYAEEHEPVTLTLVYEHGEEAAANIVTSAAYRHCMELYKESHPWVTIDETVISNADIGQKYTAMIAADDLPDLTYVNPGWLKDQVDGGMLVDLTDYVDPANYYDGLSSYTYDGKVWAMPNKYSIYNLIVYNTALWEEAGLELPTNIDELIAADAKFDEMGIDTISLGNAAKWFAVSYFTDAFAYNICGEDWVNKIKDGDPSVKYTDDCFVEVLKKQAEMIPLFNADCNMTDDISAATAFMQGKAACHVIGGWGIATLKGLGEEYPDVWEHVKVALIPTVGDAEPTLINACGAAMGVSSRLLEEGREEELQAAIEFCQQISSPDYAAYCSEHGSTTPYKTEYHWENLGEPFMEMADVINNTPHTGLNFNDYFNLTVRTNIQSEVQSLLAGATTPEAAAANIQAIQEQVFME